MRIEIITVIILVMALGVLSTMEKPVQTQVKATTPEGMVDELRILNSTAATAGPVYMPYMPFAGTLVEVNGEDTEVFIFNTKEDAANFSETISKTGDNIGGFNVRWAGTPHFYLSEKMIVIYVGSNTKTENALTEILGNQFAGSQKVYCTLDQRQAQICTMDYRPTCGWFSPNIQCIKYPCAQTFSNPCTACSDEKVLYYTDGTCPR